ncbi:leucine--tRNA ligase [Emticicia sp. C21]|uniref:leucine--tRNA ligase n=1 Tax=Emticicia sp. C21 TaxID=2302915 RepID=UPI000E343FA5|nr:leucine--tRNA ligase [Emticicia sp. C21]RFS14854.1 leucine--tRNA ligase [Emticicia sp. C21]
MSEYNHREIDKKWQQFWEENKTYEVKIDHSKPKFYVLDMFPYPSGAGLHVGHPLGYIASDIYSRYKKLKGFNVLHPMGFDSFGLPAEQYAIQTGQHPAITTEANISTYISQLKKIGFCYDWSREVRTSDPKYYKWTQWIFMELFKSWYNKDSDKAEPVETLYEKFAENGTKGVNAVCDEDVRSFTAEEWNALSETEQYTISLKYRLTYLSEAVVNFCPALGMVLSNDEVKDGVSERGGYPVIQKRMQQWMMRITAYADRLISGLTTIDWSDSLKEQQRNWIGRSVGAMVKFEVENKPDTLIEVFTTRVDTIYGVSFMVLAPEHEWVTSLTTQEQKESIDNYITETQKRSELDRMSDVKKVSGAFTGSYCINPFSGEKVPIWIADYVLAGYGTGAVMGVPSGDQRDWNFATHFNLPIVPILDSQQDIETQADATKEGKYINSGIINGLGYQEATKKLIDSLEERGIGKGKVNYRLRDAVFARQRYWGEPVPIYFKDNLPYLIDEKDLPMVLPEIDKYLPTEDGEPPLGRADGWNYKGNQYELSTMPGWAGSSWYWFRYMDAHNENEFASKEAIDYWQNVDLYLGGTEHATGHLLYSRFWNKFLKDRGYVPQEEYALKLINQGMIQGKSSLVYRLKSSEGADKNPIFVSYNLRNQYETTTIHVDVSLVKNDVLNVEKFKIWRPDLASAQFILEDDKYVCGSQVEKMSKRLYNVVNPDDIVEEYGADTFRLYEMFLGPLTESKPWDTRGIEGTHRFIRKLWRLFYDQNGKYIVTDAEPTKAELKALHKTIKKVSEDVESFSFNTSVSTFMICVNELSDLKCSKKAILDQLVIVLSAYTPHISEELWEILGNEKGTITHQSYPEFNADYLIEDSFEYPIQINGKVRTTISFPADMSKEDIEKGVLANENVIKWLEGNTPKKLIIVPKRIVNVVI